MVPFEKFKVRQAWPSWASFVVKVWPIGPINSGWMQENSDRSEDACKFIEDAIREKMMRERK